MMGARVARSNDVIWEMVYGRADAAGARNEQK